MIRIENLSKHYGRLAAVDGVNLEVPSGEIFGFLGPNGAGKTTTMRVMMGILRPTSGRVLLGGYDVEREPEKAKAITGFVPDLPFLYEKLSGREFLNFIGGLHQIPPEPLQKRILELLDLFELSDAKDDLIESYSHGMKQRLALSASLIHRPSILLIDEPMVGMDPRGAKTLKDLFVSLAGSGTTVFLSTHSISVAEEICHRVGIIHRGKLIAVGTMPELYRMAKIKEERLESAFLELTRAPTEPTPERF
jgi:ABC-2 type transport system ATP-binding protein